MGKRLLAALVCAMMVTVLLPAAALAGSEQTVLDIGRGDIVIGDGTVEGKNSSGAPVTDPNPNGYRIIGTTTANTVTVTGGEHKITLNDVQITFPYDASGVAFSIEGNAKVNLNLVGNNILQSSKTYAGLQAPSGATVTITGTGSLTATGGGSGGAGIGGGSGGDGGTVNISGGTVNANGNYGGAGIGGGSGGDGGTVNILGGTVNATSDEGGAGIGGGLSGSGGTVTISGGEVNATGHQGGAGIGGGNGGNGDAVNISGGTVNATGDEGGAGIGGGRRGVGVSGNGGAVNISGGTVNATGDEGGAGIGGGQSGSGGAVTISGGNVKATGSDVSANIGAGAHGEANGTLTNGTASVYRITLTLEGDTPIAGLTAANISSAYGMKDVKPLNDNMLYFYLPAETTVSSVTTGGTPARLFEKQTGTNITVATNHNNNGTLKEVATATISNVTVSGMTGTAISPKSVTITLTGEKFVTLNANADVSTWFTNMSSMPAGLKAKIETAVASGATTATVTFSGTPTAVSSENIKMKIPGNRLSLKKADLTATENDGARWAITSPTPVITAPTAYTTVSVNVGGSPTLSVTATNADGYQWQINRGSGFVTLSGATASSCAIGPVTLGNDGDQYRCIVSRSGGDNVTSPVFTLQVLPATYAITQGQHGQWLKGSGADLSFTANGDYSKFSPGGSVSVDGTELSGSNYTSRSGSTVVTLNAAYLQTLSVGRHVLRISFTDGPAETDFFINVAGTGATPDVPKTGDTATPALWLGLLLLAGAGLAVSAVRRKRQNG